MCPLVSHLPSHGLEGGCVDKLSFGFQMKTSFWESIIIKGTWIPGRFHGIEPLPTLVITDLMLHKREISPCLGHWIFKSVSTATWYSTYTPSKLTNPASLLNFFKTNFHICSLIFIPLPNLDRQCTCMHMHTHKVKKQLDWWCVLSDRQVCGQLINTENANFLSHTVSTLKQLTLKRSSNVSITTWHSNLQSGTVESIMTFLGEG